MKLQIAGTTTGHGISCIWSPYTTRFSTLEVCILLNITVAELDLLGRMDPSTVPVDDIDDSNVRRRYYNFWTIVRIGFHQRLGQALPSGSFVYDWLLEIEDELGELFIKESEAQTNLGVVAGFGRAIPNSWQSRRRKGWLGAEGNGGLEAEVRLNYWVSLFQIATKVTKLLSKENKKVGSEVPCDGNSFGSLIWGTGSQVSSSAPFLEASFRLY